MINKLFVYGTLLQGESRNHWLSDWKLIDAFEIGGTLYDTGHGYPAADFLYSDDRIFGELYTYNKDDIESMLHALDMEEGIDKDLFERNVIESNGSRFFAYNISTGLKSSINTFYQITSGNWRRYNLARSKNIHSFALNFEREQAKRYEVFPDKDHSSFAHILGDKPILVVACHATAHKRQGKLKAQEFYTGAISVILNSLSGVHSLYTTYASEYDSNHCENTGLKRYIRELVNTHNIKFVLDIHGTGSYRKFDIYPGIGRTGEFLNGNINLFESLASIVHKYDMNLGGTDVFPAYKQHTVSRFVNTELGTAAMQIEINQNYRDPGKDPRRFNKLIKTLSDFLNSVNITI